MARRAESLYNQGIQSKAGFYFAAVSTRIFARRTNGFFKPLPYGRRFGAFGLFKRVAASRRYSAGRRATVADLFRLPDGGDAARRTGQAFPRRLFALCARAGKRFLLHLERVSPTNSTAKLPDHDDEERTSAAARSHADGLQPRRRVWRGRAALPRSRGG
ncbi:hypothetical protein SDC9_106915 [bioreactor metagenome]|uniref:Uncharacterized protein n=1 Tax=bioreactor metagenome TaxID=1076179 RepID=A0A645B4S7_9ZZZZ